METKIFFFMNASITLWRKNSKCDTTVTENAITSKEQLEYKNRDTHQATSVKKVNLTLQMKCSQYCLLKTGLDGNLKSFFLCVCKNCTCFYASCTKRNLKIQQYSSELNVRVLWPFNVNCRYYLNEQNNITHSGYTSEC